MVANLCCPIGIGLFSVLDVPLSLSVICFLLIVESIASSFIHVAFIGYSLLVIYLFIYYYDFFLSSFYTCKQETAMKSVAAILSWCAQFKSDVSVDFTFSFLWKFFLKTITSPSCDSEVCIRFYRFPNLCRFMS